MFIKLAFVTLVNTMVQLLDYKCNIFSQINPGTGKMQGREDTSSVCDCPQCDSDDEEEGGWKNIYKYINQSAFLAEYTNT